MQKVNIGYGHRSNGHKITNLDWEIKEIYNVLDMPWSSLLLYKKR